MKKLSRRILLEYNQEVFSDECLGLPKLKLVQLLQRGIKCMDDEGNIYSLHSPVSRHKALAVKYLEEDCNPVTGLKHRYKIIEGARLIKNGRVIRGNVTYIEFHQTVAEELAPVYEVSNWNMSYTCGLGDL